MPADFDRNVEESLAVQHVKIRQKGERLSKPSHPLFLSGEFLVLLFRDKSTKKRLRRGETSHGICSWYASLYCRLTNHFLFIFTRENEPKPPALQKLPLRSDFCEPRRLPHPQSRFCVTQTTVLQFHLSSDWRR